MSEQTTRPGELDVLLEGVASRLRQLGTDAAVHHSGGGVFGVRVALATGDELFTSLRGGAWVGLDWTDGYGDMVAAVEVEVRPFESEYGEADSASVIAGAIHRVARRIHG
jgi:hypothetical protein